MNAPARRAGGTLAVLVCALAAHAAAYRSVWPQDGVHGYFGWYEPLVGALSAAAVAVVSLSLALGLRDRAVLGWLRPWRSPSRLAGARLAALSLGVLLAQESVERSFGVDHVAIASFPALTWLVILASVSLAAAALTFLARCCSELAGLVLRARARVRPAEGTRRPPAIPRACRRRHPLAECLWTRAPPVPAATVA